MENIIGYYTRDKEAFEGIPEGYYLLETNDLKRTVTYAPKVTEEDLAYCWEKRDVYYRGGGRAIHKGTAYAHSLNWVDLQSRLNVWVQDERYTSPRERSQTTILKCSYETARYNYGDLYNKFTLYIIPYYNIETRNYSENMYHARAFLSSSDDGGYGCWSKPVTLLEAKRYANRIKNYIQALQKPFDHNDFKKFVESEGHEFDHG